ncbi:MAG: hypothetical protein ABGX26_02780 [Nautiliaceae bacterium]
MIAVDNTLLKDVVNIFITKQPVTYDNELLKLLKYIQPPIRIGSFQLKLDIRGIKQSGGIIKSIDAEDEFELTKKVKLKLILSKVKSDYPYININNDEFESNYTATYPSNSSKEKVLEHIKCLMKEGNYIEIYDKYLFCDNGDYQNIDTRHNSVNIINQFISSSNVQFKIFCIREKYNNHNNSRITQENNRIMQRINFFSNFLLNFEHNNLNDHDRYIKIFKDNNIKYEIILSSGLYNILGNSDFTYVVRIF